MACFVFEENTKANVTIMPELAGPYRQLQDIARRVAEVRPEKFFFFFASRARLVRFLQMFPHAF
jgi:hypothetical protein